MRYPLNGPWQADIGDGIIYPMTLPGTLDENQIGHEDSATGQCHPDEEEALTGSLTNEPISTRFTRKYTFEGPVRLTRRFQFDLPESRRVFVEAERARCLKLFIDGREIPDFVPPTLSTPHIFEITGLPFGPQEHELTFLSDNSYPALPHDAIVYSSAATDETQTNWNGLLGYVRLRTEKPVFLSSLRVYPKGNTLCIKAELSAAVPYTGTLIVTSAALDTDTSIDVSVPAGTHELSLENLPLADQVKRWDEYEGQLYELTAAPSGCDAKTVRFGIRDFDGRQGRLSLNGRPVFLRSEANCAVFPETGYPPMDAQTWISVLKRYRSYGVNCLRFHSHCPPDAAFTAADQLGMLLQPELSHWDPTHAFESEESRHYYETEALQIIRAYANHPSFVMLTFGNELHADESGHAAMRALLQKLKALDSTRLYADASNAHYGALGCEKDSDFYTSQKFREHDLRGTFAGNGGKENPGIRGYLNNRYPNAMTNYDASMEELRKTYAGPVFGFEVGQFEVLPDFDELADFHGITDPVNLRLIQKRVEKSGLTEVWKKYAEATGELSLLCYREEVEAVLRTKEMSGISLLGLQDFPGQGTALVGMLNSHLQPKPFAFARPEAFRSFFREQLPLALLQKYTYENTELLSAQIRMANYGKAGLTGCPRCELSDGSTVLTAVLPQVTCPSGALTDAGILEFELDAFPAAARLELTVSLGEASNTWPVWVYPPAAPVCPAGVCEATCFDTKVLETLKAGGTVYLTPPSTKEALPSSIQAQFSTDFWSVGTFSGQEGGMGQLIDASHPLFADFPTESHTNWQWWPMAVQRAVILPPAADGSPMQAVITEMDSYAYLRPMAQLFECRCLNGKVLFSSMGLQDLQQYPEARALLSSLYRYLTSEAFSPGQELKPEALAALVS